MKRYIFPVIMLLAGFWIHAAPLQRLPSTPFPADFKAWEPKLTLEITRAAIARIDSGNTAGKGVEEQLQKHFARTWNITLPVMNAADARKEGRPLILAGQGCSNMITRRLAAAQLCNAVLSTWRVLSLICQQNLPDP